ncbi:MAG TPA: nuclear transport factor 2 family protein [Longimicrobiaceae bacterium]|nr:nuclear transport factor 2 family protein [Longimicrobiaceae bacterium]
MDWLTAEEAGRFAAEWLPAWTGNDPEGLARFYSEDAFYLDPGVPDGLTGKPALLAYFRRLLAANPRWEWSQVEGIPMAGGFLNRWRAAIPVGSTTLEVVGVCLVQLDGAGKIRRNEVYFDRTRLLEEIARSRGQPAP